MDRNDGRGSNREGKYWIISCKWQTLNWNTKNITGKKSKEMLKCTFEFLIFRKDPWVVFSPEIKSEYYYNGTHTESTPSQWDYVFTFHFHMRYLYSQIDDRQRRERSDMQKIADIRRGPDKACQANKIMNGWRKCILLAKLHDSGAVSWWKSVMKLLQLSRHNLDFRREDPYIPSMEKHLMMQMTGVMGC